jgi:dienelactone hydrolase
VVHGVDDATCPFAEAQELVQALRTAKLSVAPHFIDKSRVDGRVFTSSGHALGDRTEIVFQVAGAYLAESGEQALRRTGRTDFDLRDDQVRYRTPSGEFVISYRAGYPVGRFEADPPPSAYKEHQDLTHYYDSSGLRRDIRTAEDWLTRRQHILKHWQAVAGKLPGESFRVPLHTKVIEDTRVGSLTRRKISFQSDPFDRVTAWLLIPAHDEGTRLPAMLCLHQTTPHGKDEAAGLAGGESMHYGLELAQRGYVVLCPDYPSFGEHPYDFAANPEFASGTLKAVWDNRRAVDLLSTLAEVDPERIGVIGHSLGGHNAIFTALWEPRLKVVVSSCGFTRFGRDDVPSWNGPRYMPRIATVFANDAERLPFDFTELIAALAPRPFLASAATGDDDFDVRGVREVMAAARGIYKLQGSERHLQEEYPDGPHDFSQAARKRAYEFLDQHLRAK